MEKKSRLKRILLFFGGLLLLSALIVPSLPRKPRILDIQVIGEGWLGGGFYYDVDDTAEIENGNPWTPESQLRRLPIFRQRDPDRLDPQRRLALAQQFGARFGVEVSPSNDSTHTFTDFPGGKIQILHEGNRMISFDSIPFQVPDWFCASVDAAGDEQILSMLDFFLKRYGKTLGIEKPVNCTERWPERRLYISAYEGKGNLTERFVAWHFNRADFFFDGESFMIRRRTPDHLERIGYYPILSPEEARQMLLSGLYTTNPYSLSDRDRAPEPEPDKIAGVDLIYFTDFYSVTVPFYQFYLPAPFNLVDMYYKTDGTDQGEVFQSYFVPAIPLEYAKDPSVFGERFLQMNQ